MNAAAPDVRLTMPARPEGVAVVRQALAGMADALAFDAAVLADMKMAVSEACTNVVVHAYEDTDGVLEVDMRADDVGLTIQVRDHGSGIQPQAHRTRDVPALGLGLPLIAALSDAFELSGSAGHGTEVRMTFRYARDGDPVEENPVPGTVGDDGRWDPGAQRDETRTS
jgi:anti-sigma regulatory factor (Ser/Thr protein kinase)